MHSIIALTRGNAVSITRKSFARQIYPIHASLTLRRFVTSESPARINDVNLREYQQECINTILTTLREGKTNKIAISVATGGGKTVIFCKAIPQILEVPRFPDDTHANGVLIAVHRRELAIQTVATLKSLGSVPEDRIFLEMGASKVDLAKTFADPRPFVIVASVPTLFRANSRLENYDIDRFKAVIIDECHHAVSAGYKFICKSLNCLKGEGEGENQPFLLGFSATMARADKLPLNQVFDEIVFQKDIASLISENHLCDFEWNKVALGLNLEDVEMKGGDFKIESLAKHVNTEEINIITLKTYMKLKQENPNSYKSLLVFCVNVQHMQDLSSLFRHNGINAQYVSGETKTRERDAIVKDFKAGKIQVLFNCGVFTEGTDIPNIDSIFLLRPTKSKPLLVQMVGRGLRLHKGKEMLLVTDFVDSKSLGLTISSTLKGKADVVNLLVSAGGGEPGSRNNDELLPGDIQYVKFSNFKAMDLLFSKTVSTEPHVVLMKKMKAFNAKGEFGHWNQIKYNAWAIPAGYKSHFKIEAEKDGSFTCAYYFTRLTFDNRYQLIKNDLSTVYDVDEAFVVVKEFLDSHEEVKSSTISYLNKERAMQRLNITVNQQKFIEKVVHKTIEGKQGGAMDIEKVRHAVNEKLGEMNQMQASRLIFSYSVGKSNALLLWFREVFLRSKGGREKITKDTILKDIESKKSGCWL